MAFVVATKVSEVPPGRVKVVEIGDEDVALCNVGGEFYAIANVCTMKGRWVRGISWATRSSARVTAPGST
jgi:nitrite reductase/ring-hydroxylating ferredoxin subunit